MRRRGRSGPAFCLPLEPDRGLANPALSVTACNVRRRTGSFAELAPVPAVTYFPWHVLSAGKLRTAGERQQIQATMSQIHPADEDQAQFQRNARNVLYDGIGVGFASAAAPFLPVLLAQLGSSDVAVGLVTALPAAAGIMFAVPVGRLLSRRRDIIPWFSTARLLLLCSYALIGLATLVEPGFRVGVILVIFALATLPQTVVDVSFTVVMARVAGPHRRFYLMSRRWTLLGVTTAIAVAAAGLVLDRIRFPLNFQIVFPVLALGGPVSFFFARRVRLAAQEPPSSRESSAKPRSSLRSLFRQLREHRKFVRFTASQFVYRLGWTWALPLFPLFYVHTLNAGDAAIGVINTVQSGVLLVAYFAWSRISQRRGVRFALLLTTGGFALYPIVMAVTREVGIVVLLVAFAGIFGAGIDLTFFDTLVSSHPPDQSAMFVGIYQATVYVATFVAPLVATTVSEFVGIPAALVIGGVLRLIGWILLATLVK